MSFIRDKLIRVKRESIHFTSLETLHLPNSSCYQIDVKQYVFCPCFNFLVGILLYREFQPWLAPQKVDRRSGESCGNSLHAGGTAVICVKTNARGLYPAVSIYQLWHLNDNEDDDFALRLILNLFESWLTKLFSGLET